MMNFNVGDKVRIVNYGALMWSIEPCKNFKLIWIDESGMHFYDWMPERVGKEDVIDRICKNQYGLVKNGSWFEANQLELI